MQSFENKFREKFLERNIEPNKQVWERLEMMLNDKDTKITKKSSRPFLFIAASLLVFVSLGTFFINMNTVSIQSIKTKIETNDGFVIEENPIQKNDEILEENSSPVKTLTDSKIVKSKEDVKVVANLLKVEKETLDESEAKLNKEFVLIEKSKQNTEVVLEVKQELKPHNVDPEKLLMVVEYEQNVEKSASQFKQMKEKFQEVKTVLNNINH